MKHKILIPILILLLISLPMKAHDFWLVPAFFNVPSGWVIQVEGLTHDIFPKSEAAVTIDRIADARVVGTDTTLTITKMSAVGNSFICQTPELHTGDWWIGVIIKPRRIELTAEQFNNYLLHEGLDRIYHRRVEQGIQAQTAVERYSKYAKTLVSVGEANDELIQTKSLDHIIEFVPQNNPIALSPGDTLTAQLLLQGNPVAWEVVFAGHNRGDGTAHIKSETDENGIVHIPIDEAGIWYVKTIYMQELDNDPEFDYESWWTTMTFIISSHN